MPEELIHIRSRGPADLGRSVQALMAVHKISGYPTNWPADPARWLTPAGTLQAWVATTHGIPVAGHVILRQPPASATGHTAAQVSRLFVIPAARRQGIAVALLQTAMQWAAANGLDLILEVAGHLQAARALYERAGFSPAGTEQASWTTPDGQPVTLHRYTASRAP